MKTPTGKSKEQRLNTSDQEESGISKQTKSRNLVFGLGRAITQDDAEITGCRLPTCGQVLRCMIFYLQSDGSGNRTKWESAKIVLSKVSYFYKKANIPMISDRKACEKIIELLDDNSKLRAIPKKLRSTPSSDNKLKQAEKKLKETFRLWPSNVETLIQVEEDRLFLKSMKTDRSATFGCRDKVLADIITRREAREDADATRREKLQLEMAANNDTVRLDGSDDDDDTVEAGPSASIEPSARSHHRVANTGITAFVPHDILKRPSVVALATRLKMTPVQQAAYTEAIIKEIGGDTSKISTSYATADRSRRSVAEVIATSLKEKWVPPKLATLHWDSKLMPSLTNKYVKEQRHTVVVGDRHDLKLLGTPAYEPGTDTATGEILTTLTVDLLNEWRCADTIVNMGFDTTASNTGCLTAACVALQVNLNRALLWSACRKHIGEVILQHVFEDLKIEVSKSPDVTLFTRFRANYQLLPYSSDQLLAGLDHTQFKKKALTEIRKLKTDALKICDAKLTPKPRNVNQDKEPAVLRDDYREFIELCKVFLDKTFTGPKFSFKRPGALHKARWMAKLLYTIKICLFEEHIKDLPPGTITAQHQVPKLRIFVNFVTLIYSQWWMTCSSAVDAPYNDLQLYQNLLRYEAVSPEVSKSAIRAFSNHLWYLTSEMIPLALFSNKVSPDLKRQIADKLLLCKPDTPVIQPQERFGMGFGKPSFPTQVTLKSSLADFVSPDSWFMFHILKLDSQFLSEDVSEWATSDVYKASAKNVEALNVVNDCAERGVKLTSDFLPSAKRENHFQNVLQVVEKERKQQPNLRKRKLPQLSCL